MLDFLKNLHSSPSLLKTASIISKIVLSVPLKSIYCVPIMSYHKDYKYKYDKVSNYWELTIKLTNMHKVKWQYMVVDN